MPTAKLCLECGGLKFSIEYEARAIKSVTTVYSIDGAGYLDAEDTELLPEFSFDDDPDAEVRQ